MDCHLWIDLKYYQLFGILYLSKKEMNILLEHSKSTQKFIMTNHTMIFVVVDIEVNMKILKKILMMILQNHQNHLQNPLRNPHQNPHQNPLLYAHYQLTYMDKTIKNQNPVVKQLIPYME